MSKKVQRRSSSSGFTVMELLVAMGIVSILTANSVQFWSIVKLYAYEAQVRSAMQYAKIALEDAEGHQEIKGDAVRYTFVAKGPGRPPAPYDALYPGMVMQKNLVYLVDYAPAAPIGMERVIIGIYHCKTHFAAGWTRYADAPGTEGVEVYLEWYTPLFLSSEC